MGPKKSDAESRTDYESAPLTRPEYITALAHLYRAEMYRAQSWRNRLDTTTNWAILATASILTFAFHNPEYSHQTLIAGMYVNLIFLLLEARRFRFFDVWRARVRMLEENFFGPILRRDPSTSEKDWGEHVADDLLQPKFKISFWQAIKARLLRNYIYVFGLLLVAWLGRLFAVSAEAGKTATEALQVSGIPLLIPVGMVAGLYLALVLLIIFTPKVLPPENCYWPDPTRLGEDIPSLDV